MKDLEFKIKECNKANALHRVCILLSLQNKGEESFFISRAAILLDGFTSSQFQIFPQVECIFPIVRYHPKKFILEPGEEISNPLILSDVCNFNKAGTYIVKFTGSVQTCVGTKSHCMLSQPLLGSVVIELES